MEAMEGMEGMEGEEGMERIPGSYVPRSPQWNHYKNNNLILANAFAH